MSRSRLLVAAALASGLLTVATLAGCGGERDQVTIGQAQSADPTEKATYEYNVPFGTGNRMDSGEVVEIMPSDLRVTVGESIRIDNDDIRDYMIGPFFVMAGQTLAMRFTNPGTIEGVCEINPEGKFVITVVE